MPDQPPTLTHVQVLVVEDEAITRIALTVLLEHQGATVVTAGSVREGLQILDRGFQPHVLLSNIRLPDGTGIDVLRHLQHQDAERQSHTPAIALTGETLSTLQDNPDFAGFQHYLSKPFDSYALVNAIVCLVARSQ
ncbi:response regulator [Myxacorys almedinensis]|uniref:Response regulator n=1 Tax=Myxacorys almedinensis A TaxID=2690445 RepID=A0A8J7Z6A6_9CYAN|nr:response regulator [Myxacorys almedinensis]NDJ17218.1 response regulator [Myxacorys almedinensis A]